MAPLRSWGGAGIYTVERTSNSYRGGAPGGLSQLRICLPGGQDLRIQGSSPALGYLFSGEPASLSPLLVLSRCLSLYRKSINQSINQSINNLEVTKKKKNNNLELDKKEKKEQRGRLNDVRDIGD